MDKKRILLVEDEKDMVYALTLQLEAFGFEVVTAADGQEGLSKARKEKPDLIIMDIMMPNVDGYQACRMIKFDTNLSSIPIIMLTSFSREDDKERAKKVHADAYFTKPFKPEKLLAKIKSLIR